MSNAISSPSALFTTQAYSTHIQLLSIARLGLGLGAFIAPALFTQKSGSPVYNFPSDDLFRTSTRVLMLRNTLPPLSHSPTSSVFGFTRTRSVNDSNNSNPSAGSPEELSIAVRLFGARDIGLGLLLRDSASAVVERGLQMGCLADILSICGAGFGYIEGTLSQEVASGVGLVGLVLAGFQAYILNK
ncbi:hypothetical protein PCANC_14641 [Puccinia coronata f. sp. avenae]|uniref:Uncharacterized protein n=1 Tax=Puccinia coronata f. sp. avenae TaxID=200324 RepID=A0A2N5SVX7_9BASI|nr:hypothetical protein PCANC_14641 [Puccinia coronata f. sp. avenae]